MKKILIIEDEKILREAYIKILTAEGFEVYEAADGKEGILQLKAVKPDLVLLDVIMPNMDGLTFLREAKLHVTCPDAKVIAFSNLSDQHKMDEMLQLGSIQHILKSSLSPKELVSNIRQLIT